MRLLGLVSDREFDQRLSQLHQKIDVINRRLGEIAEKIENQSNSVNLKLEVMAEQLSETSAAEPLFGERTYRLFHADQEQKLVRAFPGNIFNRDKASNNPAFVELLKLANGDVVAEGAWERILLKFSSKPHRCPELHKFSSAKLTSKTICPGSPANSARDMLRAGSILTMRCSSIG